MRTLASELPVDMGFIRIPMNASRKMALRESRVGRMLAIALIAVVAAVLIEWLWRSALGDALRPERLLEQVTSIRDSPFAAVLVVGGFVLAELVLVPVTILIAVLALAFPPLEAFAYAIVGATLSAVAGFAIGRRLGRDRLRRLAPERVTRISEHLGRRGVLTIVLMRMLPLGPFTLGNLVAGVSHVRVRDLALGTVIGMAPGIMLIIVLAHGTIAMLRDPTLAVLATLALPAAAMVVAAVALRRLLQRHGPGRGAHEEPQRGAPD